MILLHLWSLHITWQSPSIQEKRSLYTSQDEFKGLIKQVLSWDIRSVSQRNRPHPSNTEYKSIQEDAPKPENHDENYQTSGNVIYHLILEGLDVSYRIDRNRNVFVEKVNRSSENQTTYA